MTGYLLRRLLFALPILLGINLITFSLFFMVNTPDDMARMQLGTKNIKQEAIEIWKKTHGYHLPLFYNAQEKGLNQLTQTLFVQKSMKLFVFDFGQSDAGRNINDDIKHRAWPSLAIALPTLVLGIFFELLLAMGMVFFRNSWVDFSTVVICIVIMSISGLFFIIGGQYLFARILKLVPFSGYDSGLNSIKFLILPIFVAILSGLGAGTRWYRLLFLEEFNKDYVKTARAKGLSEPQILFKQVLKNVMLPLLTGIVVVIPSLFMGSLILESWFGIPGLGSYIIDAVGAQDFAIVRAMVFLGSVLYILGLVLTDISYTLVDPRLKLT